jgi:hypothetical protein
VEIDLLNSHGQKVQSLFNAFRAKGTHRLSLIINQSIVAGNYIIRVKTKTSIKTIKLIIQ